MKKLKRKICRFLYNLIAKRMPLSNSKIKLGQKSFRRFLVSKMIVHVGKNVNIEKGAFISSGCSIGDNSGVGVRCELNGTVKIGNNVLMGPDVIIYTVNHQFSDKNKLIAEQGYREEQPVTICDDVWIGRRVMIMPGTTIGKGAVIGAGAVVAKDIPEYAIAVGNPVKIVGYRC